MIIIMGLSIFDGIGRAIIRSKDRIKDNNGKRNEVHWHGLPSPVVATTALLLGRLTGYIPISMATYIWSLKRARV